MEKIIRFFFYVSMVKDLVSVQNTLNFWIVTLAILYINEYMSLFKFFSFES